MAIAGTITVHALTVVLTSGVLLGAASDLAAQEKHGIPAPPSPMEKAIPDWTDAAKTKRKFELALDRLPDLQAVVEVTEDPCRVNIQVRNNSHVGLTREQWSSEEDAVRLEIRDITAGGVLVEDYNWTFRFIDSGGNLMRPRGETMAFPWPVPAGANWHLRLIVDVAAVIEELDDDNTADAWSFCPESD